jgi:hypothetical protein
MVVILDHGTLEPAFLNRPCQTCPRLWRCLW